MINFESVTVEVCSRACMEWSPPNQMGGDHSDWHSQTIQRAVTPGSYPLSRTPQQGHRLELPVCWVAALKKHRPKATLKFCWHHYHTITFLHLFCDVHALKSLLISIVACVVVAEHTCNWSMFYYYNVLCCAVIMIIMYSILSRVMYSWWYVLFGRKICMKCTLLIVVTYYNIILRSCISNRANIGWLGSSKNGPKSERPKESINKRG